MQLKLGICSASLIANDFIISLRNLPSTYYKIVAVGATSLESAQKFAKKFNIPKAYGSYKELAEDQDVEVVYVSTINVYHYMASKLMIEHGKHVLVEKPFTIDVNTTIELFELGKKYNVFIMEMLWTRYLKAYQIIREILKNNEIGEVIHCEVSFIISNFTDRIVYKNLGGGVVFDLGVYALNSILEAVGYIRPTNIKAFGRFSAPNEADVSVSAILDFPSECTAAMTLSTRRDDEENLRKLNHFMIVGRKGYIRVDDWINCPKKIEVNGKIIDTNLSDNQTGYNWKNSYGLFYQFAHARECIIEKKLVSPLHTPQNTILLTETMRRVLDEIGAHVVETPKDYNFKAL